MNAIGKFSLSLMFAAGSLSLGLSTAHAAEFTVASFSGTYAHKAVIGANAATALGICTADGLGNFSCPAMVRNRPNPDPAATVRRVDRISITGTITLNPDGSGSLSETITDSAGVSTAVTSNIIVTSAEDPDGESLTILDVYAAQQEVAGGALLTSTFERLPD